MSENPKDDDWAMTDPNLKLDPATVPANEEQIADSAGESPDVWAVQPVRESSPAPAASPRVWEAVASPGKSSGP